MGLRHQFPNSLKDVTWEADQRWYLGLIFRTVCVNYLGTKSRNATEICWCRKAGRYCQGKGGFLHQENWRLFTTGVTEVRFKLENTKSHTLQDLAAERLRKISIWKFLAGMTEKGKVPGEGHQGRNQWRDVQVKMASELPGHSIISTCSS